MYGVRIEGALVILMGILIMATAILLIVFSGPLGIASWWQLLLLVFLWGVGLGATIGGSEMRR